jgi:hypothetical protein
MNKPCFIISHKYYRGYPSYLEHYLDNIQQYYPDALTVVVDNNSVHVDDIWDKVQGRDNLVLATNTSPRKFEVGAYAYGLDILRERTILSECGYIVLTQDTFILKNKFDFEQLTKDGTYALPINSMVADGQCAREARDILTPLGLHDNMDKIDLVWCNSFAIHPSKADTLCGWLKQIECVNRGQSCASERYLGRILWELNERKPCGSSIDGRFGRPEQLQQEKYDFWTVDPLAPASSYFVKQVQQKNETTRDTEG